MSKKRARFEKAWRRIETAAESGEPVEGTVIEVVKGGLIIDLGVRGFLPASLVDIRRVPNLDEYMGTKIEMQGHRAQPLAQQRRALAPRRARGGAQGGPPADPRPPAARPRRRGPDLEHRRLRRVRRPRRHRRPDPHLRAVVVARQPPERDPRRSATPSRSRCSTSTATASASRWVSSRPRRTRGSGSSTPTTSATSSRARSPRSSRSARSSRSSTASRASCTSPSWRRTTSRTRARSSSPGDEIRVKILEIDSERRRLSLSAKRVEDQILPVSRPGGAEAASETEGEEPDRRGRPAPEAPAAEPEPEAPAEAPVAEAARRPRRRAAEPSPRRRRARSRGRGRGDAGRRGAARRRGARGRGRAAEAEPETQAEAEQADEPQAETDEAGTAAEPAPQD